MSESQQPWVRLSRRGKPPVEEALYEGVPVHLRESLVEWLYRYLSDVDGFTNQIRLQVVLRLKLPVVALNQIVQRVRPDEELFLDVLDATLWVGRFDQRVWRTLENLLVEGGSAWRVAADHRSLERRVDDTVAQAAQTVISMANQSAGDHLATAWKAAYGLHPDATKAYSEAIKAVEAAAAPVVSPSNAKATLGTIIGDLKQAPDKWELAILDPDRAPREIGSLLGMLELLWQGQSDRHGGVAPTVPIPSEAAPMAVHLALLGGCDFGVSPKFSGGLQPGLADVVGDRAVDDPKRLAQFR
jgi:hypothetical protein